MKMELPYLSGDVTIEGFLDWVTEVERRLNIIRLD